jgi:hypothetical protein
MWLDIFLAYESYIMVHCTNEHYNTYNLLSSAEFFSSIYILLLDEFYKFCIAIISTTRNTWMVMNETVAQRFFSDLTLQKAFKDQAVAALCLDGSVRFIYGSDGCRVGKC